MTRYFVYEVYHSSSDDQRYYGCDSSIETAAIIDETHCICLTIHDGLDIYSSSSRIGHLESGRYKDGRILLETTSIEEYLESDLLSLVDPQAVAKIKRLCL